MSVLRVFAALAVAVAPLSGGAHGTLVRICAAGGTLLLKLPIDEEDDTRGRQGACHAVCAGSPEIRRKTPS